jgi:hypothetical protein
MDVEWAKTKLQNYLDEFNLIQESRIWRPDSLVRMMPTVREIISALGEDASISGHVTSLDNHARLRHASLVCLGILDDRLLIRKKLAPDVPTLPADSLHPWVWSAAEPSWRSELYRAAVHHAATALCEQIQKKVNRFDISDSQLVSEAFSEKEPSGDTLRLRVPGNPGSQTVRSRQVGALALARGVFLAIRNPAAHETVEWSQQESLEYLATISTVARIIESCITVGRAH